MNEHGQSALEYIFTYGWALLVIAIVIAALFAFGLFGSPNSGFDSVKEAQAFCEARGMGVFVTGAFFCVGEDEIPFEVRCGVVGGIGGVQKCFRWK